MSELFTILRQYLVPILIGLTLFLTLLFGETFQVYFVLLLIGLGGLFVNGRYAEQKLSKFEVALCFVWLAYLFAFAVSTIFSHVFVDSLHKLFVQLGVFVWFVTTLHLPKRQLSMQSGIFINVGLLSLLFLLTTAFPLLSVSGQIPNSNVLIARHGHNLLAGVLVLIFPVVWQYVWELFPRHKKMLHLLIIFFSIVMALTFSRSALLILVLQFSWLFWVNGKESLVGGVSKILVPTILLGVFLALPSLGCSAMPLSLQLCKPLSKEMRPEYWRQASDVIREYPAFGYSVGSFSPISHSYAYTPHAIVKYAHNAWLEQMATGGVLVGFVFLLLTIFMVVAAVRELRREQKKASLQIGVSLGVLGYLLNSLVGYDWSIFGSQLLFVFFVALLLREARRKQHMIRTTKVLRLLSFFLALVLVLFGIGFYLVDFQIRSGRVAQAFASFPYYFFHKPIYFDSEVVQNESTGQLEKLFQYDPELQRVLFLAGSDSAYLLLSPWSQLSYRNAEQRIAKGEVDIVAKQLQLFQERLIAGESRGLYIADYQKKEQVAQDILLVANALLADGQYERAGLMYHLAVTVDEWAIHKQRKIALPLKPSKDILTFLRATQDIPTEHYGVHGQQFVQVHLSLLKLLDELSVTDVQYLTQRAVTFDSNVASNLWKTTSSVAMASQDVRSVDKWFEVWRVLSTNDLSFEYAFQEDLARALIENGNRSAAEGEASIGAYYSKAISVIPWASSFAPHFLASMSPDELTDEQVLEYAEAMLGRRGDALAWNFEAHAKLFARAAKLSNGEKQEVFQRESKIVSQLD
ncbi:MAG: O-antigen ligase family protein [bacterium]|nr:O-antigen ligase family protein [bacterium]